MQQRNYNFSDEYISCGEQTIAWACRNSKEKLLLFYLKLKRNYRSGEIHNPKKQYTTLNQGLSYKTYNKRINDLILCGWAISTKRGIRLISIEKMPVDDPQKNNRNIKLKNDETTDYIILRAVIKNVSQRTQKCAVKFNKHSNKAETVLSKNSNGSVNIYTCNTHKDITFSNPEFAKAINRSKSTAIRINKTLADRKIIRQQNRFIIDPNAKYGFINHQGIRFRQVANSFELNLPKINYSSLSLSINKKNNTPLSPEQLIDFKLNSLFNDLF